jgi:hypothetical protein
VENPRTSRYVMALMQDQVLDQEFSKLPKQDSLRFADASIARMKPESVTELTAHCSQVYCKKKLFFLQPIPFRTLIIIIYHNWLQTNSCFNFRY